VNALRSEDRSFVVVTHYERILNYFTPDHVHVLAGGKVVMSGDMKLALELEAKGYDWINGETAAVAG
jgi:Fe-S cluster assembly ATP-binding protein